MNTSTSLIDHADTYVEMEMNILLFGQHGVGKTFALRELADRHGLTMKYFSCSTLDPYVDIVGIPRERTDGDKSWLEMVRLPSMETAELIFFDELNRVEDPKVLNAIFEIVQFGTINGEPLPNLKMCWAAANMSDDSQTYHVQTLDDALVDRFDAYQVLHPVPSVEYMSQDMPSEVAEVLVTWWKTHDNRKSYISPRRLHKIGTVVSKTKNTGMIVNMMPPGGSFDSKALTVRLDRLLNGVDRVDPTSTVEMPKNNLSHITGNTVYKPVFNVSSNYAAPTIDAGGTIKWSDGSSDTKHELWNSFQTHKKLVSCTTHERINLMAVASKGVGVGILANSVAWNQCTAGEIRQIMAAWSGAKRSTFRTALPSTNTMFLVDVWEVFWQGANRTP